MTKGWVNADGKKPAKTQVTSSKATKQKVKPSNTGVYKQTKQVTKPRRRRKSGELTERKTPKDPSFWTKEEDAALRKARDEYTTEIENDDGTKGKKTEWKKVSVALDKLNFKRSDVQCLHRWNKCLRPGLIKGAWTYEEDVRLKEMIEKHGGPQQVEWAKVAQYIPGRLGKQCRERYFNHLDSRLKKGKWDAEEDRKLMEYVAKYGKRWAYLSTLIEGRSENHIKNRWYLANRKKKRHNDNLLQAIQSIQTGSRKRKHVPRKRTTEDGIERLQVYGVAGKGESPKKKSKKVKKKKEKVKDKSAEEKGSEASESVTNEVEL